MVRLALNGAEKLVTRCLELASRGETSSTETIARIRRVLTGGRAARDRALDYDRPKDAGDRSDRPVRLSMAELDRSAAPNEAESPALLRPARSCLRAGLYVDEYLFGIDAIASGETIRGLGEQVSPFRT